MLQPEEIHMDHILSQKFVYTTQKIQTNTNFYRKKRTDLWVFFITVDFGFKLVQSESLKYKNFSFNYESEDDWHLKYVLHYRHFLILNCLKMAAWCRIM